ncbi:MAG: hypothetical protein WBA41_19660, partial [Rivularia sp. (in: cyanobacteria)]
MVGSGWEVFEAASFERGVASCGGHPVVEDAIAAIKFGLNRNPKQFLRTSFEEVFLAKTKLHRSGPEIVMAYSIWFRIHE